MGLGLGYGQGHRSRGRVGEVQGQPGAALVPLIITPLAHRAYERTHAHALVR